MLTEWMKRPMWAAEDGTGGGDAGDGKGDDGKGAGADPGQGDGGKAPDPGDGGKKPAPSLFDLSGKIDADKPGEGDAKTDAKPGDKPLDPGGWKPPEGVPDHLKGKDADETLAKVAKAYAGARAELAKGGKKGTVPETADGYALKPTGEKDPIAAEWASPESKVMVDAFQDAALEVGMSAEAFQGLMRKGMEKLQAQGVPIGLTVEEQIEASADQEFESLKKMMGGHKEAATVFNTVDTYRQKLLDSGLMTKDEETEFRIMVGTGPSAALFYKIMTAEFGERAIPPADPMGGQISLTDAYAQHAAASAMKPGAERDAAIEAANRSIQKATGTESAGSIRSNVL